MKWKDLKIIYVDTDYIKYLHSKDSEVFYSEDPAYKNKPYLGILITACEQEYVIPLTSAKAKHASWKRKGPSNFIIYEEVDIRQFTPSDKNILVPIPPQLLTSRGVSEEDTHNYFYNYISVLEIKKMVPVKNGVYQFVNLNHSATPEEAKRNILLNKEYRFCKQIQSLIQSSVEKLYIEQMQTGKIKKFCCNFHELEQACSAYMIKK